MSKQKMNVRVIKAKAPSTTTKQIYEDEFKNQYGSDIIPPPYNLKELKQIAEYSTILQQCIDAYRTNIVGFGLQPEYTLDVNDSGANQNDIKQAGFEWTRLEEFIRYLNFDESAETILGFAIEDREKTGNGFIEVLRDGLGETAGIEHIDAQYMRVCTYSVPEEVEFQIYEKGAPKKLKRWKKFRKFVQMINGKKVFFKEYGDPRPMNLSTGKFDESTPEHLRATELIHLKIGSGSYGIPRWIGHIVSLYGARKAEELNYMYFKQGRHTPAAIMVQNGMLSEASYTQLQDYMNNIEGVENAHKFLLLEAEGIPQEDIMNGGEKVTPVNVEIKSLAEILQQDALFLEYDEKTRSKLRSSFRLPPLYTGESQDYTKATADTARKVTEEQVFQPERNILAGKLNTLFLPDLNIRFVKMLFKGPDFRDPLEIAKVLTPFVNAGAASPNDLRDLLGRVLGKTLEEWPEEFNKPFQMLLKDSQQSNSPFFMQKSKGNSDLIDILKDLRDVIEEVQP